MLSLRHNFYSELSEMPLHESLIRPNGGSNFGMPPIANAPAKPGKDYLARRWERFVASLVDGIAIMLIYTPIQIATGYFARQMAQNVSIIESLAMSFIFILIFALLQGYLLYSRGQTIGKMLLSIQAVDSRSGRLLPFFRVFFLRHFWLMPVMLLMMVFPILSPLQLGGLVLGVLTIVDVLLVFSEQRRCLHDYIAGSIVVEYRAGRAHV